MCKGLTNPRFDKTLFQVSGIFLYLQNSPPRQKHALRITQNSYTKGFWISNLKIRNTEFKCFEKNINVGLALTVRKRKAAAEIKYGNMVHLRQTFWSNEWIAGMDHLSKVLCRGESSGNKRSESSPRAHCGQPQIQSLARIY